MLSNEFCLIFVFSITAAVEHVHTEPFGLRDSAARSARRRGWPPPPPPPQSDEETAARTARANSNAAAAMLLARISRRQSIVGVRLVAAAAAAVLRSRFPRPRRIFPRAVTFWKKHVVFYAVSHERGFGKGEKIKNFRFFRVPGGGRAETGARQYRATCARVRGEKSSTAFHAVVRATKPQCEEPPADGRCVTKTQIALLLYTSPPRSNCFRR